MAARTICKQGSDLAGEPMADYAPLKLHVPEPAVRPGDTPDFSNVPHRARWRGSAATGGRRSRVHPRPRFLDHPRSQPRRRGGGPVGRPSHRRRIARRPAQHDDAARLRRAHADGAAPGQDLVLHAAHGRRGRELCLFEGAPARRHELPDLPAGGAPDRRRLSAHGHDVPDLLQRARPAQGAADAGALFVAEARLFLAFGKPRHAIYPGRRLGDGFGDQERYADRGRLDRRRRHGGIRFPCGARVRVHLQGAGGAQYREQSMGDLDLPGHRPRRLRHVRGARPGLRHSRAQGGRQRLSCRICRREMGNRARPPQSRPHLDRICNLPRWRALDR